MELRSITGVDRVFKTNLNPIDKSAVYSDHPFSLSKEKMGVEKNEVLDEIVKTLGKYPPVKNEALGVAERDSLKRVIEDGGYQPDLESLADKLISLI